jgi:histidinol-phosphate aminotransferase
VYKRPGSLLILCSPNNPTGASLSGADVKKILVAHTGVLALDQAYIEFGGFNAVSLLKSNPNLIVLRTFSKAFAGAGLRLGYMLGTPEIIGQINKIKLPYNINFFTEQVAGVLVTKRALMQPRIDELVRERDALLAFCDSQPFDAVYKSNANFFMVQCAKKKELFAFLKSKGILVRDVSSYPLCENCLRINVGNKEENKLLTSAITAFFAS